MRITIFQVAFTALFACSLNAKEANSQDVLEKSFNLTVDNTPLKKVIIEIQRQTRVKFTFSSNAIKAERTISYSARDKKIGEFLTELYKQYGIDFKVLDNKIILYSAGNSAPSISVGNLGNLDSEPAKRITGNVRNDKGEPVAGVTVTEKNKSNAVITDEDGIFSITVESDNSVLLFTSVGYENQELAVNGISTLDVLLKTANKALEEVVVVGYGTQKRKDLTGSVSSVNTKELKSLPVPSIGEALQGRAAGMQVISSGIPGSNVVFRIRGTGTINNSDPLLVIDGIPTDIPLNTLSPDDISTVEILKDASAAAIYGARGANGVVIITTKRGSSGRNNLEFKMFAGQQKATSMIQMLDASQFASLHNEMMASNGQSQNPGYADPLSLGKGTDWLGALFGTAPIQNYSLAYSGGSAKSNYYVSGTMLDQQGIVLNTG